MSAACDHRFVYGGLRYADGRTLRPGSGAVTTYYAHAYHCERCLEPRVEACDDNSNSYQSRKPGSTPASHAERLLIIGGDR